MPTDTDVEIEVIKDRQNARSTEHLKQMQVSIAQKIYDQSKVIIPLLLLFDVLLTVISEYYKLETSMVVAVSSLIGIALNNAYRERQSILEFLFGSSVGSKSKDELKQ
jgi:hypothetical protein